MNQEAEAPTPHIWAYGYKLSPPVTRLRLEGIQTLLDDEHRDAQQTDRIWSGRLINGDEITHILIVSGTPDQELPVNLRLAQEFDRLAADYLVTAPLVILDLD